MAYNTGWDAYVPQRNAWVQSPAPVLIPAFCGWEPEAAVMRPRRHGLSCCSCLSSGHLGTEPVDGDSPCLYFSHFAFQMNTQINKCILKLSNSSQL